MQNKPDISLEVELTGQGFHAVAGVDEAGRGPLAGPVVAAAVILPQGWQDPGVNDSKKLSQRMREHCFEIIINTTVHAWGMVSPAEIDEINIHQASLLAMRRAVEALSPDYLLLDGRFTIPNLLLPQQALVKGDGRSCSIAAASILAKVRRDHIMQKLHEKHPAYNFAANKGYPTKQHLQALHEAGPCAEHRKSYGPVANLNLF